MIEKVERIAAFSEGAGGGNPAGVWIAEALPSAEEMLRIAAEVGYSETAFAAREPDGVWRVRYFAPETEVPFCGHATIALGAALGARLGAGVYPLRLNDAEISVEALAGDAADPAERWGAALVSPPTWSRPAASAADAALLRTFGFSAGDLLDGAPPMRAHAGADHLIWRFPDATALERLGVEMAYPFDEVRRLMESEGYVTIALVAEEAPGRHHARNAFAPGGVREDPATGAAAAAFAGLLRDRGEGPADGTLLIRQGVEMGRASALTATASPERGAGVRVAGAVRWLTP